MKKTNKKDSLNLLFSSLLIVGYIICSYFFLTMGESTDFAIYIQLAVFAVFGLILFYATRVGEGKPVVRFSLWTLILVVLPSLYAILAQLISVLPLHQEIANLGTDTPLTYSPIFILACVALGYGIPYTFLSGFEIESVEESKEESTDDECHCCDCEETEECHCCECEDNAEESSETPCEESTEE